MKARYIKPEMSISEVECENIIATSRMSVSGEWENGFRAKDRGMEDELWVEDVDLWGDECWTKVM